MADPPCIACPAPPVLMTFSLSPTPVDARVQLFCRRHFWDWVAECIIKRAQMNANIELKQIGQDLRALAAKGILDPAPPPAPGSVKQ